MTTYRNGSSIIKSNVRYLLADELLSSRKIIRILSLPADNFLFEQTLEKLYPKKKFVFTCLEYNSEVWERGNKFLHTNPLRSKVDYINTSTTEFLETVDRRKKFDLIWLDYCSKFHKGILTDIQLCSKITHGSTVVATTLMGRREHPASMKPLEYLLGNKRKTLTNIRERAIPIKFGQLLGIQCIKIIHYQDTMQVKHASPMYLYIHGDKQNEIKLPIIRLNAKVTRA